MNTQLLMAELAKEAAIAGGDMLASFLGGENKNMTTPKEPTPGNIARAGSLKSIDSQLASLRYNKQNNRANYWANPFSGPATGISPVDHLILNMRQALYGGPVSRTKYRDLYDQTLSSKKPTEDYTGTARDKRITDGKTLGAILGRNPNSSIEEGAFMLARSGKNRYKQGE